MCIRDSTCYELIVSARRERYPKRSYAPSTTSFSDSPCFTKAVSYTHLDVYKRQRVACETLVTTGQVVVSGEVRSNAYVDLDATVRRVVDLSLIHI